MNLGSVLLRLTYLRVFLLIIWLTLSVWLLAHQQSLSSVFWGLLVAYSVLLVQGWRRASNNSVDENRVLVELLVEAQLCTGLLYFTGGATNPLISYFLLLLVVATYSLPFRWVLLVVGLSILDYSLLMQWYRPLSTSHPYDLTSVSILNWHLVGMWLTFVVSALILVMLIPNLVQARQQQQKELQILREKQLQNEQLIGIATLAAGTAHELGTPLMTINLLLDELESTSGNLSPEHAETLNLLRQQTVRCKESLQRLAHTGRQTHQTSNSVDSRIWIQEILSRWQHSHPKASWQTNTDFISIEIVHSSLLDQALLNLLNNATEAGTEKLQLSTRHDDNYWYLDIIQPDTNAHNHLEQYQIFESQKSFGLGLGMYLSNASIEQYQGHVRLSVRPNGGTCCSIALPVIERRTQS